MNPRTERIKDRCRMLLQEVAQSGLQEGPSSGHHEEAVLGCAVLALTQTSVERQEKADHLKSICAALVQVTRADGLSLRDAVDQVAGRMAEIWTSREPGRRNPQ